MSEEKGDLLISQASGPVVDGVPFGARAKTATCVQNHRGHSDFVRMV